MKCDASKMFSDPNILLPWESDALGMHISLQPARAQVGTYPSVRVLVWGTPSFPLSFSCSHILF